MFKQEVLFTNDECKTIIEFNEIYTKNFHKNNSLIEQDEILYKANILPKNPKTFFIFKKLFDFFEKTTRLELYSYPAEVYIMKYEKGDKFKPHTDNYHNRVYSVGVQLNTDYTGGDYIIYNSKEINKVENIVGNSYCMESSLEHEIKEIESGIRYSIVSFIKISDLITNQKKTLI
jgi:hypothetical protein